MSSDIFFPWQKKARVRRETAVLWLIFFLLLFSSPRFFFLLFLRLVIACRQFFHILCLGEHEEEKSRREWFADAPLALEEGKFEKQTRDVSESIFLSWFVFSFRCYD